MLEKYYQFFNTNESKALENLQKYLFEFNSSLMD